MKIILIYLCFVNICEGDVNMAEFKEMSTDGLTKLDALRVSVDQYNH